MQNVFNSWWVWALRGVFAIIFGVLAIVFPGDALQALIYIFGAYALVDGAVTSWNAITDRAANWGWHLAEGVISILAGIIAFISPGLTGLTILLIIGFWRSSQESCKFLLRGGCVRKLIMKSGLV